MSLPDTAEYWHDIKAKRPYTGKTFFHIPNAPCGHRHLHEAKKLGNVNCYACLELVKQGYVHGLQEGIYLTHGERKRKAQQEKRDAFIGKHGKCQCGSEWVVRTNPKTGICFLGCSSYPKCKNTKAYTP